MTGKNKCKILKDIRRRIAEKNNIDLVIKECTFQGECKGTCPRCEAEVRYLEKELEKRKRLGQSVAIAGIVTLLAVNATGCKDDATSLNLKETDSSRLLNASKTEVLIDGEIALPENTLNVTAGVPEFTPYISFAEILNSNDNGVEYLSQFTREEIIFNWKNDRVSTSVTQEVFKIEASGKVYYVTIAFDSNDKAVKVTLSESEEIPPTKETGFIELQGDVAFPEEN